MQQPTLLQTHLYQFVTAFNTALIMQDKLCTRIPFSFALKIDNKLGYLFLDVISNADFKYRSELLNAGSSACSVLENNLPLGIVGKPHSVTYTMDMTTMNINVVRSHLINVDHAISEVNEFVELYNNLQPQPVTLFKYNNLGLPSVRDTLFKNIASSMLEDAIEKHRHIAQLSMGTNSFIIPRLDSQSELDGIILEINNLSNEHCSNVCLKYITKHHTSNDIMFVRNAGDRLDMAPLNHKSIVIDDDYYGIINAGLAKGTILTEVYKDITEAS